MSVLRLRPRRRYPVRQSLATRRPRRATGAAFTLLEVLLSMVLLVVLISVVAGTIDFHLKQLTMRKTRIEESQLARVVLRRIADDLRAVAVSRPIDIGQATADAVSGTAGAGAIGGAADAMAAGGASSDLASVAGADSAAGAEGAAAASVGVEAAPPAGPGLYGTAYQLQLDVGRIPRFEEYSLMAAQAQTTALGLASDVRTVTYYLAEPSARGTNSVADSTSDMMSSRYGIGLYDGGDGLGGGLVRRAVDRAVERYAMETADYGLVSPQVDVLAPEVVMLEFQYFDGSQWLSEWDSDQMGGVPLAVQVAVQIDTGRTDERTARKRDAGAATDLVAPRVYRLVVQLPAAEPLTTSSETDEAATEADQGASSSSAASGSGSTGASP